MEKDKHIWTVLMAGGLGSRFWPISDGDCPKQFTDVMGSGRTLLQSTFERMCKVCPRENIVIITGEQYVGRVHQQVEGLLPYQVLGEPRRRNTAPCIAYAASIISRLDAEATIIVAPSDHAVFREEEFCKDIQQAICTARRYGWIITLGAMPVRPDTNYGYIQFSEEPSVEGEENLHRVVTFTEKPPLEMARQFIATGEFLWNAGILVWQLPTLLEAYREHLPEVAESFGTLSLSTPRAELERIYSLCESISVDKGIMEKVNNVHVLSAAFGWSDVETWESLYDVSSADAEGNVAIGSADVFSYNSRGCLVTAQGAAAKTIIVEGLEDYIVASTDDTVMICRRSQEDMVFKFSSDVELRKLIGRK